MKYTASLPVINIISGFFIFLFVYTALDKLFRFSLFNAVLKELPLVGKVATIFAYGLPLGELGVALLLFNRGTRAWGLALIFWLLMVFAIYIGYMSLSGSLLPCSCGGILSSLSWGGHLLLNLALAGLAAWAWRSERKTTASLSDVSTGSKSLFE